MICFVVGYAHASKLVQTYYLQASKAGALIDVPGKKFEITLKWIEIEILTLLK